MFKRRMLKKKFLALLIEEEFYLVKAEDFQYLAKLIDHHNSEPFYFLGFLDATKTTYRAVFKEDIYAPGTEIKILKGQNLAKILYE